MAGQSEASRQPLYQIYRQYSRILAKRQMDHVLHSPNRFDKHQLLKFNAKRGFSLLPFRVAPFYQCAYAL